MLRDAIDVKSVLVVSRDSSVLRPLWSMGVSNGWRLEIASDPWEAIDRAQSGATLDLLLLDLPHGNADVSHSLRWLRRLRPALPIILIGHSDDRGRKQESLRMGVCDYLIRPIEDRKLEQVIQRNISNASQTFEAEITSVDVEPVSGESCFIGVSPIMRKLRAQAALLAEASVSVLILGEDGSGKETTARLIHNLSVRSGFEFARVNCAALPEGLLERELFGYEREATTTPARIKTGKVELCEKGTIFLDEITEMSVGLQSKLLEMLKNKRFVRPGSSEFVKADVRIVAASSKHVELAISERRLNEDLYHQLGVYTIHVPSLRDRKEELSLLSRHFMHRLARHYGLSPRDFSPAIMEAWQSYYWPGNLRELERCVKRYMMVGDEELALRKDDGTSIDARPGDSLAQAVDVNPITPATNLTRTGASGSRSLRSIVQSVKAEAERSAIAMTLEKTGWNRKAAARLLKVSYRTVLYKIEQYKITASNSPALKETNTPGPAESGLGETGFSTRRRRELLLRE